MIQRVLMTIENRGRGVQGDPVRNVMLFHREDDLTLICVHDSYAIEAAKEEIEMLKLKGTK